MSIKANKIIRYYSPARVKAVPVTGLYSFINILHILAISISLFLSLVALRIIVVKN